MATNGHDHHLPGSDRAVYAISVAAELSGIAIQTLRLYEQRGLITPARSPGGTRRYSGNDLARLHRITTLAEHGINLAGISRILDLEDANTALRNANTALEAERDGLHDGNGDRR